MHSTAMRGNEKLKCHVKLESLPQATFSRRAKCSPYHSVVTIYETVSTDDPFSRG